MSQFSTNNLLYRPISEMVEDMGIGLCSEAFYKHESSFQPCDIYRGCPRDVPRGKQNVVKTLIHFTGLLKINHSPPIYRYISEMVEDRWVCCEAFDQH